MNNDRRKLLSAICAELEKLASKITEIEEAEQEAYDNMPEGLQQGDKGEAAEGWIERLSQAAETIGEIVEDLGQE